MTFVTIMIQIAKSMFTFLYIRPQHSVLKLGKTVGIVSDVSLLLASKHPAVLPR